MQTREEVIEAAMLARMVGSHLSNVDQMTVERSNNPANKIVMDQFVAPLLGKKVGPNSQFIDRSVSPDIMKAYEGVNELALQSVPDAVNAAAPYLPPTPLPAVQQAPIAMQQETVGTKSKKGAKIVPIVSDQVDYKEFKNIAKSLKNIDKTLSDMLTFLQSNNTVKDE